MEHSGDAEVIAADSANFSGSEPPGPDVVGLRERGLRLQSLRSILPMEIDGPNNHYRKSHWEVWEKSFLGRRFEN